MAKFEISRQAINPVTMSVNPLECIVNAGHRVISQNNVYQYVGIGWVKEREAEKEDFDHIPLIID